MRKAGFWKADWLLGLMLSGVVLVAIADWPDASDWTGWAPRAAFVLVALVAALLTAKRVLATRRGKAAVETESAQGKRMLGLGFQGQGQLDFAFEQFRKCPVDDALIENLHNLALDFERKQQRDKAAAVFRYIAVCQAKRPEYASRAGSPGGVPEKTPHQAAPAEILELGRYQIDRALGKGAMGAVYLAHDAIDGRAVAIKTLALSQAFDADELADVKARFFREAETAGRLKHQNIVTIYEAGEEGDLAYIAMEFLSGRDLAAFTKPDRLLPLLQVVSIIARVAEALAYAHGNNVVHRDVKPANVMYDAVSDLVKVMDFGVARITDSSRTKTGMVLGTPSYMSPEQLSGKKIDGRSDLFSLGVTLYQMACGRLPFVGESMAQLMFRITSEAFPDIRDVNPQVPDALVAVLNRALCKDSARRYATGDEMARDLRACLEQKSGQPPKQHPEVDIPL